VSYRQAVHQETKIPIQRRYYQPDSRFPWTEGIMPLSNWRCSFILSLSILMLAMEAKASVSVTPFLTQSFLFDWNPMGQTVPIPTTPQCETINVTWGREGAFGPNPTAPYYFEVYTSTSVVPFIIPVGFGLTYSWAVPFSPGTLYQICMFDGLGNTGGCQATYTVIAPLSTPSCSNVTFPPILDVEATVESGPLSEYGWVDQCTVISILPKNGTPPYTLTIAPALHPPYNITSNDMSSINWTVSLSYASQFFIGLYDSAGNAWSNGPLHSGFSTANVSSACLSGNATASSKQIQPVVAIGAGIGGLVAGLLIGLAVALLFIRRYYAEKARAHRFVDLPSAHGSPNAMTNANLPQDFRYSAIPTTPTSRSGLSHPGHTLSSSGDLHRLRSGPVQYHVEPFVMPDENGRLANEASSTGGVTTPPESVSPPASGPSQLYVLHHDSNVPPVTIFHESGTEIVELPPRYPRNTSPNDVVGDAQSHTDTRSDGSRTDASQPLSIHEPRQLQQLGKSGRS